MMWYRRLADCNLFCLSRFFLSRPLLRDNGTVSVTPLLAVLLISCLCQNTVAVAIKAFLWCFQHVGST